jgi:ferredoxin, 2Fe-2S
MVTITFRSLDGSERKVEGHSGNLMELARKANIAGIDGECGGSCSCGTCHIYLSEQALALLGPATKAESDILEFEPMATPQSRLSCQIRVSDLIDGLTVTVVKS